MYRSTSTSITPELAPSPVADFDPAQPRDPDGRWSGGASRGAVSPEAELPVAGAPPSAAPLTEPVGPALFAANIPRTVHP